MAGLLLLWLACSQPRDRDAGEAGGFPHPTDYAERSHGADALADPAGCVACHRATATTGAPACTDCHDYPHPPGFDHGTAWSGDSTSCTGCHGASGDTAPAGLAQGTCTGCHAAYPHPSSFDHGDAVLARGGSTACVACHADDDTTCAACHDSYPHPDGFDHGAAWSPDCTESCHGGTDTRQVRCEGCHDLFPHPDDWTTAHAAVTQARGALSCVGCHAAAGPLLPVPCGAACHTEAR